MISVNQNVTDAFKKNYSIKVLPAATIDINCNMLLSFDDDDLTGTPYAVIDGKQPFKKLFPLDTIVKSFRPLKSGIKYGISGDIPAFSWTNPRDVDYIPKLPNGTLITYRTYYPSKDIYYKYFISPVNTNISTSIRYYTSSSPVSEKNKKVPCNKIVFKFELAHSTPSSWSVLLDGSDISASLNKTVPSTGVVELYYNGTSWSRNESDLNMNATVMVSTLGLTATNPGTVSSPKYLAVIELAPHWVKDLTPNIVALNTRKETSSSSEDILPVGNLTANSIELSLNGFNQVESIFKTYKKYDSFEMDTDFIYFVKHAEVSAYYKIYHTSGDLEDSFGKYYKVPQGIFMLDNWAITEYGEAEVFGLDYSKILQETICPDIVCDGYSAVAIIRRILDSVGFTNYNFNYTTNDQSIITPDYWWSDSTQTVWSVLQEICRDTQMSASVDHNNVLQFYSRDYMFSSSRQAGWSFYNETLPDGTLPNIVSMNIKELPSVNQVRVLYSSAYITTYEQSAKELVSVDSTSLTSASLTATLPVASNTNKASWTEAQKWISVKPVYVIQKQLSDIGVIGQFSGYLLVNSEIIEYDAIEYEYTTKISDTIDGQSYLSGQKVKVAITGPTDIAKYRGKAETVQDSTGANSILAFASTNRYRIKTRGAFGTKPETHSANINYDKNGWVGWKDTEWRSK
jgi:hypothetical protein